MKKFKLRKKYIAGIAALVLAVASLGLSSAYAAGEIDLSKPCSLTVNVGENSLYAKDLQDATLQANVYKIATVDKNGVYTSLEDYKSLDVTETVLKGGDWGKKAQDAALIAEKTTPDAIITITQGAGTAENLEAGMYLVQVENGVTDYYEYKFSPYLICLPDNAYAHTGNPEDDSYQYEVTAGLKPEQSLRYGQLQIAKTLTSYNESLEAVTFVFQVEAVDKDGEKVYSNVVSATFDKPGTEEIVIDNLPAGSSVTVTEVYSGASYQATSELTQNAVIVAEEMVRAEFENAYAQQLIYSNGITNHFDYDGTEGWTWTPLEDNSEENQ